MRVAVLRSVVKVVLVAVPAACFLGSCSDGSDVLDDACKVIVTECDNGNSVGECIDQIGDEPLDCLDCIVEAGCDYPTACSPRNSSCRLPIEYL